MRNSAGNRRGMPGGRGSVRAALAGATPGGDGAAGSDGAGPSWPASPELDVIHHRAAVVIEGATQAVAAVVPLATHGLVVLRRAS
jgi:hypothetical protein